jgi:hypothetical protein
MSKEMAKYHSQASIFLKKIQGKDKIIKEQ